jgi:heterodisulfide reductase subunit A-like polyferredoxin
MLDVGRHSNIELLAYSEVENVEGKAGDFKVTVRRKTRYVEEDKCTGCGACAELMRGWEIVRQFTATLPRAYPPPIPLIPTIAVS